MRRASGAVAVMAAAMSVVGAVPAAQAAPSCPPAVVSVAPVAQYEGNGPTTVTFEVRATAAAGCAASGSVRYRTADHSAEAGSDYTAATGILSWTTSTTRLVPVTVAGDLLPEDDEQFMLELFEPRGLALEQHSAAAVLLDDDGSVTAPVDIGVQGGKICWWPYACTVSVRVSTVARAPITVRYRTIDGTAVGGEDFVAVRSGVATIQTGATGTSIPITILPDDKLEQDEYFLVELHSTSAGTVTDPRGMVTITRAG